MPPRGRRFDGAEAFQRVGQEMVAFFRDLGGLTTEDRVLDLGCGIGRIAIPLTSFLAPTTRYVGLDINRDDIDWCQKNLSKRYSNFDFVHVDVHSKEYHPEGKATAEDYRLPFDDGSFDFVCAISLFTHLTEAAASNYSSEISRVLSPGGRCFLTFFLINAESREAVEADRTQLKFQHLEGDSYVHDPGNPEGAIAFEELAVTSALSRLGLDVAPPFYGFWSGQGAISCYQDIVVATRSRARASTPKERGTTSTRLTETSGSASEFG